MQEPNREKSDGDLTVLDKIAQVSEDPFDLNRRTLSSSLDLKLFHLSNQNNDSLEPASKRRKLDDLLKAFETSGKVIDLTKDDSPKSSVTHGREAFETSEKVIDLTSSDDESLKDSATGEIQQIDQQPRISDEDEPAIVENSNNSSTTEKGKPQIIEALNNLGFEVDEVFRKVLKTHQVEGLKFMWQRVYEKRGGCLLAHSMGLGKTLQTIALLTSIYQALNRAPESDNPTVSI
ncbi:hypothetical protein BDF20DRAFT_418581 [Mycotypha africana]|uniref:uncharacterized protein n=1 Tax=Mycotypha africana TaxID=64632 RepID=UPI0023007617|nr:uncharacterized protein BDF20DRAFT_418581 [Mycotypha africana]KAI8981654.1 hypothetical protein BDF20DRAFT_418581 [Mycotypha africana]